MKKKTMNQLLREELAVVHAALHKANEKHIKDDESTQELRQQVFRLRDEMRLGVEAQAKRPYREIQIYVKDQLGRVISNNSYLLAELDSLSFSSVGALSSAEHTRA